MMLPVGSSARLRARFRDQFTPVAGGYLYRRGSRGAALPVSAADAEAFVAAFERASRLMRWGGVVTIMVVIATLQVLGINAPTWTIVIPFMIVWCAVYWLIWTAPHRVLNGRAPVAPALSGSEVRRRGLQTLPWHTLALGALLAFGLAARIAFEPDPFAPTNLGYLAVAAMLLLFFGGMALAKIRAR